MENKKELTMTDFFYKEVRRTGDVAELIFDHYEGDKSKPVRLIGFQTEAWKTDNQIREEGFFYFKDLQIESERLKRSKGSSLDI